MKKVLSLIFVLVLIITTFISCGSSSSSNGGSNDTVNSNSKEKEFHTLVSDTQELLDTVADDIYTYWYDCIYEDKYNENINYALAKAVSDNQTNIDKIKANNETIKSLYSEVRNGKLQT